MRKGKYNPFSDNPALAREEEIKTRSRIFSHLSASLLGVLFVFSLCQFELDGLKGILVDALYRTQWRRDPHPAIQLIAFDDESSRRYETGNKLPAEEIAQIADFLVQEKPRAVAIISPLNEKIYSDAELMLIGKSLSRLENVFVGYTDDESLGKPTPAALAQAVTYLPGFISRDTFSYGADSVSRRVMITIDGIPTVYSRLASLWHSVESSDKFRHAHAFGRTADSLQTFIHWHGRPGTYPILSSESVAQRKIPRGSLAGKVVLIGTKLSSRRDADFIFTPYSRAPFRTSALEGAAHGLATLMRDDGLKRSPEWLNGLLTFLIGLLTVNLVLYLAPGRGILFVVGEVVGLTAIAWVCLFQFGLWLDLAHPLMVACVGYYLVIPYRLVDEYRKRWHYQEKSEFMAQLELLKSNFLSLISHDLKTPIARIQGNAELALNENSPLTDKQKKCLDAIVHTTDDLSQYVETVLDLTRIESSQVPIQKVTKDVNATVLEVVESKRFLAVEKNITLVTQLEPLFSIKFDVKLIRRVLSNLVENAIKYSPPDSTISLSSREENNWIRITVTDHGMGIAPEEQEKVFSKFYRCENDATRSVKGTGLGLYLVKYFVELHQGAVNLKSELGKGSEFTVSLPV